MKITELQLKNFKRFTDLTIRDIPTVTRLVLLIGTNGSGKSSVFDAFNLLKKENRAIENRTVLDNKFKDHRNYYQKVDASFSIKVKYIKQQKERFSTLSVNDAGNSFWTGSSVGTKDFYGRSSLRQTPQLKRTRIGQDGVSLSDDDDNPNLLILRDNRFENDIDNIAGNILAEVFKGGSTDTAEIRQKYIAPINEALTNIFNHTKNTLELISLSPPLEQKPAQLIFRKGGTNFHYDLLSSGEKEIINILLNLLSRRAYFQDTIYYIDEMDVHLNTALQYYLLREITENWIPARSQLWIASHSLGFIDYAQQAERAVIIDFDDLNFDLPQVLIPEPKTNFDVYEIAVSKDVLNKIFSESAVYFVENKDDEFYNSIGIKSTIFIPENDKNAVYYRTINQEFYGIIDRDFLTDTEILDIERIHPNLNILPYYSIENYLYHPKNLAEYYAYQNKPFDQQQYINDLIKEKNRAIESLQYKLASIRESYPFFKEPNLATDRQKLRNRYKKGSENFKYTVQIGEALKSDKFAVFYPLFPMKTYGKTIPARGHINKRHLVKTMWFKTQIEQFLGR